MKMRKWAVFVLAFLLLLSGCSNKEKEKEPVKKEKTVTQTEPEQPEQKPVAPYFYPLTGVSSETSTDSRAVAVMINNHPKARPQSGLNQADLVYEILAEGDITRFLAVFQSEKPANIGPVRSARDYYIYLAKGLNALYIAHGYSPEAKKLLNNNYIDNLNGMVYDGTLFKRSKTRKAPHNSYITYENILKGAKQKKYSMEKGPAPLTFLTEEESKNITGTAAKSVKITYSKGGISNSKFEFDAATGKYKRFSGDEQTVDLDTKEPVLVDNIFIVEAKHRFIDSYGRREIDFESGGKAYLLQKGKVNQVEWKNKNGEIVPVKNGEEVPLVQGKTWINVVPTDPGLEKIVSLDMN
jgi:major membrane immunogen (membrane-anchored lipoprotein)